MIDWGWLIGGLTGLVGGLCWLFSMLNSKVNKEEFEKLTEKVDKMHDCYITFALREETIADKIEAIYSKVCEK